MSYHAGAFAGPVEDFKAKIAEFTTTADLFLARIRANGAQTYINGLKARIARLPVGAQKTALTTRADELQKQHAANRTMANPVEVAIAKARAAIDKGRALLATLHVPGFGVVDPVTLTVVAASLAAIVVALAAMRALLSRDDRLAQELNLEDRKLTDIEKGLLPPDAISKPTDLAGTLTGLGTAGVVIALLVIFGPKLAGRLK